MVAPCFSSFPIGFGQAPYGLLPPKDSLIESITKIVKCVAFVFSSFLVGTLSGGVLGGLIGASIAIGLVLTGMFIKQIWKLTARHSFLLPDTILKSIPHKGPPIGKPTQADLLLISKVEDSFEWKKELVQTAESSIEISPNYGGGKVFNEFLEIIEQRMLEKPNLKVHLICAKELIDYSNKEILDRLSHNSNFRYLMTSMQINMNDALGMNENHVKLLIVDEKYFIIGGSSITDEMTRGVLPMGFKPTSLAEAIMPNAFCDADVIGKGDIASTMREEFFKLYSIWEDKMEGTTSPHYFPVKNKGTNSKFEKHPKIFKNKKIKLLVSGPEHGKNNPITLEHVRMIHSAQKTIRLANQQFLPANKILDALQCKKDQNIEIIAHQNHQAYKWVLVYPSRKNYKYLTKIYEYNQEDTLYHKKIMTIDNKKTIIGSYNFSQKSAYFDHEMALVVEDEDFTTKVIKKLDKDILLSKEYPKEEGWLEKIESAVGVVIGLVVANFT